MIFKCYAGAGRHRPKCKTCNKQLEVNELVCFDHNFYYCSKCGQDLKDKRVALLESKITRLNNNKQEVKGCDSP